MNRFLVFLLAAGWGTRAGGPKAWLEEEGKSLLARQFEFLLHRFLPGSIAVSVQEAWLERCRAIHPQVRWVPVDPDASPLAALQVLLKDLPMTAWSFVFHVDMPVWEEELFYLLASHLPKEDVAAHEAVVPTHNGRGGHPVFLAPALAAPLAALDPKAGRLDHFLKSRRVRHVEVPYPCVLENWNWGPRQA